MALSRSFVVAVAGTRQRAYSEIARRTAEGWSTRRRGTRRVAGLWRQGLRSRGQDLSTAADDIKRDSRADKSIPCAPLPERRVGGARLPARKGERPHRGRNAYRR